MPSESSNVDRSKFEEQYAAIHDTRLPTKHAKARCPENPVVTVENAYCVDCTQETVRKSKSIRQNLDDCGDERSEFS